MIAKQVKVCVGVPTDLDVKTLNDAYGVPTVGTLIEHQDLEQRLGVSRTSARYRTIIERWRKKLLRESGIELGSERCVGYRVLTARQRVDVRVGEINRTSRAAHRTLARTAVIPTSQLDPVGMKVYDHVSRTAAANAFSLQTHNKELKSGIAPPKQLPRGV